MAQGKISAKQEEILEYIKSQILERGFPPSVRDICERRMDTFTGIQLSLVQSRFWMILLILIAERW